MAKHRYTLLEDAPLDARVFEELDMTANHGDEIELDLSAEQRKAMVAAGWISEPLDADEGPSKSKGGKT